MPKFEKPEAELPSYLGFRPVHPGDWIDMEFVLREIEEEFRSEVLAIGLETMANVHQSIAEGARKVANTIRAGGGQQRRG
ncbi:MAG: hypothetical protein JO051_12195 [Acidobacteriaceae bacterium]|nr:hypothetical protein [Acidobacteriaceae bacterium]